MHCFKSGLILCLLMAGASIGEEKFAVEIPILAGESLIDAAGFRGAAPFVGDFDGDGLNDLLVGQSDLGRLRIYRNVGTKDDPQFDDFEWFRANGEVAELPGEGLFRPQLVDLDGDGKLDIVSASDLGMIFWYRRIAGAEFGDAEIVRLASGQVLNAGANSGANSGSHVVDWDGDGDLDLIISDQSKPDSKFAEIWFVENQGSPSSLSLAAPRPLEIDGESIKTPPAGVCPFVADWNRDGTQDLLLGLEDGCVTLYENKGDPGFPLLTPARQLVARNGQPAADDVRQRGQGGTICVMDWDNDGRLDILIGDAQSETVRPATSNDTLDRLQNAREESARVLSAYRKLRGLNNRLVEETQEKQKEFVRQTREKYAQRLEKLRDEVLKLEKSKQPNQKSHGYIWLLRSTGN